jgi:bifunctional non-homologous end joining protein LigD
MPLAWDELAALKSGSQFTIADALQHLQRRKADPWADHARSKQTLKRAMKALGVQMEG